MQMVFSTISPLIPSEESLPMPQESLNCHLVNAPNSDVGFEESTPSESGGRPTFNCDFKGCKARPFKRVAELNRHKSVHDPNKHSYPCLAIDCCRVGKKAFYRQDKLKAHILAGHDSETVFVCGVKISETETCGMRTTRDLMAIHHSWGPTGVFWDLSLESIRTCPIPKCSFKAYATYYAKKMEFR
jgi:hypothetical protein